ncbi:MAG TPA: Uma2 family endonuclease [Bryobacteraceae bacterium]|nr:Uma2 family endonuclease [Bryobacteraceae bacterium]
MEAMQLVLNDIETDSPIRFQPVRRMSDDEYFAFCAANPELRIERTAEGEIEIMPPTGFETGDQNADLTMQLRAWAKRDGRGRAVDSSTEYFLPSGAARSPDASWVLRSRLATLTRDQKKKFLRLCPDFVVELRSPSDRLRNVQAKMREWMDNGAKLGWLIDPDSRSVYIYRPGRTTERLVDPRRVEGEPPIEGCVLEMADIWNPDL